MYHLSMIYMNVIHDYGNFFMKGLLWAKKVHVLGLVISTAASHAKFWFQIDFICSTNQSQFCSSGAKTSWIGNAGILAVTRLYLNQQEDFRHFGLRGKFYEEKITGRHYPTLLNTGVRIALANNHFENHWVHETVVNLRVDYVLTVTKSVINGKKWFRILNRINGLSAQLESRSPG